MSEARRGRSAIWRHGKGGAISTSRRGRAPLLSAEANKSLPSIAVSESSTVGRVTFGRCARNSNRRCRDGCSIDGHFCRPRRSERLLDARIVRAVLLGLSSADLSFTLAARCSAFSASISRSVTIVVTAVHARSPAWAAWPLADGYRRGAGIRCCRSSPPSSADRHFRHGVIEILRSRALHRRAVNCRRQLPWTALVIVPTLLMGATLPV